MIATGLAGLVLAFALQSTPTQCAAVNFNVDYVYLHCEGEASDRQVEQSQWPSVWHRPHLTARYNAEMRNGELTPLSTPAPEGLFESIRQNTLNEQRRWRIRPAQYPNPNPNP